MRQNDLSLANFILRFGAEEVLLDHAEEIVIPAFVGESAIRTRGDATYRFHNVVMSQVGIEKAGPILAISGPFIKDTVLRRQQIFRRDVGIVEDVRAMESAPSAFFVLFLNNHRLLYFAETVAAPSLDSFRATAEYLLKEQWHAYIRRRLESGNVTRRGVDRLTIKELERLIPPPVLAVVPVAGEEEITAVVQRFKKIKQIKFKLVEPNDELDASAAIAALEHSLRPLRPTRLEIVASDPRGMNKVEAETKITEVAEGQNTHIEIDGEDAEGLRLKVDNDEFALSIPIEEPPADDAELRHKLVSVYNTLAQSGKVRRISTSALVMDKVLRLVGLL